jgi:hypothetical protein
MLWLQGWFWMLFVGLIVFLLLLFPTGRLPSSSWRPFAWASVGVISAAVIWSSAISPDGGFNAPPSPVQLSVLLLGGVAAGSVIVGRRNARGVERQQIKWLLYVGPLFFIAAGLHIGFYYFWLSEGSWGLWGSYLLVIVGGLSGPIAIGVAILHYRLYEIDLLINRTLVYGSLTATLIVLYFGGIVVLQRVFVSLTGQRSTLAVVASTLLIAALFTPLRRRIQSFIDRRFYRRRYDTRKTLEAFSAQLRDETDLVFINQRRRSGTIEHNEQVGREHRPDAPVQNCGENSQIPPSSDSCTMMVGMASSAATISGTRSHPATRSARKAACVSVVDSSCVLSTYPECLTFYARKNPISDTSHQDTERRRSCEEC